MQDVLFALRQLRRSPSFAVAAVLTLATGIGGTAGIFSVLDVVAFRTLSYPDADRLVIIHEGLPTFGPFPASAADALKLTSRDLFRLRVIDEIIAEPLGGAHRDPQQMANMLRTYLLRSLRDLKAIPLPELLELRYQKFRKMGVFDEGVAEVAAAGNQ